MNKIDGKRILITGGTGSLGHALVESLLNGEYGNPEKIIIFSRDEAKQHDMKIEYPSDKLQFIIGDVRDERSVRFALVNTQIVIHAAALKHVSTCERYPAEALKTNAIGALNIVNAIREYMPEIETVVGISSDKGCHPVNTYGCTKFLQEAILLNANIECPNTRFVCVCYGNVMFSRGSVLEVWSRAINKGEAIKVTNPNATRFLISLPLAVATIMEAIQDARRGEIYIPIIPAASINNMAIGLINNRAVNIAYTSLQPGEKMHEVLITIEEAHRVVKRGNYYVVTTAIQESPAITKEYVSCDWTISKEQVKELFVANRYIK